jgi:hypothetical protein
MQYQIRVDKNNDLSYHLNVWLILALVNDFLKIYLHNKSGLY